MAQSRGDAARGETKAKACAACHGEPGRAPLPLTPWLAGQLEEVTVLQLILIREGLREVPQMAGMLDKATDPDLMDIAAYYARQAPPRASSGGDAGLRARGAGLARSMGCGSCHLDDYSGQKQVPRLANQREDYLAATLKSYRDNKRTGPDTSMNGIMYRVSDGDIEALAHFLAHQ
ncbi:MAG TPA: c-type cytochrome [Burkholderiales bacterium]|nr:c-type cytochrome [Burkholderiales bacterium]